MPPTTRDEMPLSRAHHPRRRLTRRSLIVGAAFALTSLPSCGLFAPSVPPPRPGDGTAEPTATPSRLFGVIPVPVASTSTPTPEPVVVRFGHWESGAALRILQDINHEFSLQTPNIVVRPEVVTFGSHFERLQLGLAAGNAPDVFVNSGAFLFQHARGQQLLDLSSHYTSDGLRPEDYWSEPTTRTVEGKLVAMPLWASIDTIFINRDHFDRSGVGVPPFTWTWGDLLDLAVRLTLGKPGGTSRWGLLLVNEFQGGWGSFATSNGGRWIDLGKRRTTIDAATRDALHWVTEAINVHHVTPNLFEQQKLTLGGTVDPFINGDVSMFVNGTWEVSTALSSAKFQWDILRLPHAPRTSASTSLSNIQPGCVASATAHPDEAWRWLRYLVTPESQSRWNDGKVRVPGLKSACTDANVGYGVAPPAGARAVVGSMADSIDLGFTINWQPFRSAVLGALEPAFAGQIPLDSAIATATQAGDKALGP